MNAAVKIGIVIVLLVAVGGVVLLKSNPGANAQKLETPVAVEPANTETASLPRLIDLGAGKCIPCKMMAPILEELKAEYAGALEVVFIDVWQDKSAGERYRIQTIPCQIFYDASGKELFRHEGFFSKEDILSKWKELGVNLQPKGAAQSSKT